jgi:hypothetical protein
MIVDTIIGHQKRYDMTTDKYVELVILTVTIIRPDLGMICDLCQIYSQHFKPFHRNFIIRTNIHCQDDEPRVERFKTLTIDMVHGTYHPKIQTKEYVIK